MFLKETGTPLELLAPVQTTPFITGIFGTPTGEDGNGRVRVVVDDHLGLALVIAVQATDVLCQCPLPGDRHRQKQSVETRIVEALAQVTAGCQNEPLFVI